MAGLPGGALGTVTINGVNAVEIVHDYEESVTGQGLQSRKVYCCDWSLRYTLANGLLGLGSSSGSVGSPVVLTAPAQHPESPNMRAMGVRIKGAGRPYQGAKQLAFDFAIITVEWGVPPWQALPSDDVSGQQGFDPQQPFVFVTQELEFGAEFMRIPGRGLFFGTSTTRLRKDYALRIPHVGMVLTMHRFPWLPAQAVRTAPVLNDSTFLGCAPGKLRFDGARTRRTASTDGTRTQEVTLRFTYRDIAPWDYDYNPDTGNWEQVLQQNGPNGGLPMLTRGDMTSLIPQGYWYF